MVSAYRRVIVSTNVAETGLTLESLRYCIDTALQLTIEFNPRYGLNIVMTKPTTSSMSLQRKGRVGRKHPGVFFPLFTEKTFKQMIVNNTPDIQVANMTSHLLALIAHEPVASIDSLPVFKMLTPPSNDSVNYSLERLFTLGAIDASCKITDLGKKMNTFRKIDVESSKMILSGIVYGASLKELVCLACLMSIKKSDIVFDKRDSGVTPYSTGLLFDELYQTNGTETCDTMNYYKLKAKLLIGCEMLELLLIYQRFSAKAGSVSIDELGKWCLSKGLNLYGLCKATEEINDVYWQMLEQLKINPLQMDTQHTELYQTLKRSSDTNTELIDSVITLKKCIYEGYKNNLLIWNDVTNSFQTQSGLDVVVKSPIVSRLSYQKLGTRFDQERPKMVIYKELVTRQDRDGRFVHEASLVSVMDGFVHVDIDLYSRSQFKIVLKYEFVLVLLCAFCELLAVVCALDCLFMKTSLNSSNELTSANRRYLLNRVCISLCLCSHFAYSSR